MAVTNCQRRAKEGVMDQTYIENRLDTIEARIDDLCGLLGEVMDEFGIRRQVSKPSLQLVFPGIHPCLNGMDGCNCRTTGVDNGA